MIVQPAFFLDLDKIAVSGQCFRWQKIGERAYRIPVSGRTLVLRQPAPNRLEAECAPEEWERLWASYLDLGADYAAYADQVDPQDNYLSAAVKAAYGVRVLRQPLWETMASFIISQNNNIPRIQKSIAALCGGDGNPFIEPQSAAALSLEALRAAGLGYRAPYLKKAALRYVKDGLSDSSTFADYGEAKAYLMSYDGVGPKVADCVCLFALGMKDAFPVDTWVKRILSAHYAEGFPLERYQGFAGVVQQWLFYYERLQSGKL